MIDNINSYMILDIISLLCAIIGCTFCLIGSIGILKMDNFLSKTHAAGLTDTAGVIFIIASLTLQAIKNNFWISLTKMTMMGVLIVFISPLITHILSQFFYKKYIKNKK